MFIFLVHVGINPTVHFNIVVSLSAKYILALSSANGKITDLDGSQGLGIQIELVSVLLFLLSKNIHVVNVYIINSTLERANANDDQLGEFPSLNKCPNCKSV